MIVLRLYKLFGRNAQGFCEPAYGAAVRLYLVAFDANDGGNAHAGFVGELLLSQEGALAELPESVANEEHFSEHCSQLLRSRRVLTKLYQKSFVNGRFMVYMPV